MSKPIKTARNPVYGAMRELIAGMSALNMQPNPKPESALTPGAKEQGYLTDLDYHAEHALEHFNQALEFLEQLTVHR